MALTRNSASVLKCILYWLIVLKKLLIRFFKWMWEHRNISNIYLEKYVFLCCCQLFWIQIVFNYIIFQQVLNKNSRIKIPTPKKVLLIWSKSTMNILKGTADISCILKFFFWVYQQLWIPALLFQNWNATSCEEMSELNVYVFLNRRPNKQIRHFF